MQSHTERVEKEEKEWEGKKTETRKNIGEAILVLPAFDYG